MTSSPPQVSMHPTRRAQLAIIVTAFALFALYFGAARLIQQVKQEPAAAPDEKEVAALMLEEKLSGPGYFLRTVPLIPGGQADTKRVAPHGRIRVTLRDAQDQLARVVAARHFDAEKTAKAEKLIEDLSEPSGSRLAGETTIDLLKLNLALDEIR